MDDGQRIAKLEVEVSSLRETVDRIDARLNAADARMNHIDRSVADTSIQVAIVSTKLDGLLSELKQNFKTNSRNVAVTVALVNLAVDVVLYLNFH